jgi:ubiquinone/menaquinone biosynthesis C-methylase UbiE
MAGSMKAIAPIAILAAASTLAVSAQRGTGGRLFAPADLGLLETPDRHEWQQPTRIMDALGIADGDRVADIGAGGGWFTIRLARQVGPNGVVYAEDIQPLMIESIDRRARREGLANVRPILGTPEDPKLPANLTAVLMCDVYPQLQHPVSLLKHIAAALAPNGLLGVVDFRMDGAGGPGPPLAERVAPEVVERDAALAGLELRRRETFLKYQYFLVFGRR